MSRDPGEWIAPPGTVKLKCPACGHWFASKGGHHCATCSARGTGKGSGSISPFEPVLSSAQTPAPARRPHLTR